MKKILILMVTCACLQVKAQSLIDSVSRLGFTLEDSTAEKLALLAVSKNPGMKVLDKEIEANLYVWKSKRSGWLSSLTPSFNLNEGNLKRQDSALQNLFYPRYNFNLSLPLSTFFVRPKEAKQAKALYEESKYVKDAEIAKLKNQIKAAYQNYLANTYYLALQESLLQDEALLLSQTEDKFKKNQVSLEVFTNATKRYNAELVKKISLVRDVNTSKIELEGLLGMTWEEALAAISNPPSQ